VTSITSDSSIANPPAIVLNKMDILKYLFTAQCTCLEDAVQKYVSYPDLKDEKTSAAVNLLRTSVFQSCAIIPRPIHVLILS